MSKSKDCNLSKIIQDSCSKIRPKVEELKKMNLKNNSNTKVKCPKCGSDRYEIYSKYRSVQGRMCLKCWHRYIVSIEVNGIERLIKQKKGM